MTFRASRPLASARLSSPRLRGAQILLGALMSTIAFSPAFAIVTGCTGGMNGWNNTKSAPYPEFDLDNAGALISSWNLFGVPTMSIISSPATPVKKSSSGGWNPANGKFEGGWSLPQRGMVYHAGFCYDTRYKPYPTLWNGKCDSTTLTIVCSTDVNNPNCENGAMAKWLAANPLQPNQAVYMGWVQTCIKAGESAPTPANTDSNFNLNVNPPQLPLYDRQGSDLKQSWDDFSGKH